MDFDAIITGIRKAIYGREVRESVSYTHLTLPTISRV